jgi:paraquat-inducible protein B
MSRRRRANPVLIGAFVLGALALGAFVVIVWGSGRLFRHTATFVSYFSGSVNGLNLGAPVKFHGVQIGTVTQIRSGLVQAATIRPEEFRVPVWFDIDLQQLSELGGQPVELDRARVDELIARGLRAKLELESFVTGVLYFSLEFLPDAPVVLVHADRPEIFEIPTVPTTLEQASEVIAKFMAEIERSDIDTAVHSITAAVDGVNQLVRSPEVSRAVTAAREALESIRRLSNTAEPRVQLMMRNVEATGADARHSLRNFDAALTDVQTLIDREGPLNVELTRTLVDLGEAARSIRDLASYLERNPNALLVGRPRP